ncbi:alcohol dehydrogenase catalytic domain-containing protein [[Clostridium] innocuum]|jgi:L-iditol 2-dehydrogenase|nr:alcohol dehydrogenase catalytic domain-containing protein [Erysipelotrichaceae bacterium]MCR0382153.1 alcohol dehydrogenase catalytic domain-containing protein [[Clostridium] innocuum]MCR0415077.1 alcohol dehydrogenase catalytic domain-containing protein [[Clostridium] innocuum]MCR0535776.1 alcohol dehydrogenase catalytic domain-containing protein [[Clostridium] innocuum]MCR0539912.1 alcohol dehydrogenase catalytic domain-containing protein [[Clostridium] innocuum]
MKQALLKQQGVLAISDIEEDLSLRANEVLIEVKAVTICGSDLSYFQAEKLPHHLQYPLILGHEMAGIVKETGTAVASIQKGDCVAVEPQSYCGHCNACIRGDYNFCESLKFMASKGISGALKQYVKWPQGSVYKLENSMSFEEGALLEPLSVAYSAIDKLDFHKDSRLVILGAGSIGLLMGVLMQVLYPEVNVHLVDIYESKRDMGERLHMKKEQFLIGDTYDLQLMKPFTHIIDTTGNSKVVKRFLQHSILGAVLLEIGVSDHPLDISFKEIVYQGLRIIGSYRYTNTYPKLLKLFREQRLHVCDIITGSYPIEAAQTAFEQALDGRHHSKIAIYL